ncbi:MAG: FABP family protein [Acidimicrobiales bacterium]
MNEAPPPTLPECAPLAFLLGDWRGTGRGGYPTIDEFRFEVEMRITQWGAPYLAIEQRTWLIGSSDERIRPSHAESGYLRCLADGALELLVATAPGQAELATGTLHDGRIELASRGVLSSPSASAVRETRRSYWLDGETLRFELEMAAVGQPMTWHLAGELRRETGRWE